MYKIITHDIVEEHFAYPGMNPEARQFERDSVTAWAKVIWELRSLVIDITGKLGSADELETKLDSNIVGVGNLLTPYYSTAQVDQFIAALRVVIGAIKDIIKAIAAGQDIAPLVTICRDNIVTFATLMHTMNPDWWAVATVHDAFTAMAQLYVTQTQARMDKEWMAGITAADAIYDLMVGGSSTGQIGFADIFSQGIIQQSLSNTENT